MNKAAWDYLETKKEDLRKKPGPGALLVFEALYEDNENKVYDAHTPAALMDMLVGSMARAISMANYVAELEHKLSQAEAENEENEEALLNGH